MRHGAVWCTANNISLQLATFHVSCANLKAEAASLSETVVKHGYHIPENWYICRVLRDFQNKQCLFPYTTLQR
jgi:hypothetical protein